ncbi:hypothetical protein GCM10017687_43170 [Streptomyces echinatus]
MVSTPEADVAYGVVSLSDGTRMKATTATVPGTGYRAWATAVPDGQTITAVRPVRHPPPPARPRHQLAMSGDTFGRAHSPRGRMKAAGFGRPAEVEAARHRVACATRTGGTDR